ncbi:MAG TPA: CHAP domain-containing protein, partial [Acidimicrobiales bacterium]
MTIAGRRAVRIAGAVALAWAVIGIGAAAEPSASAALPSSTSPLVVFVRPLGSLGWSSHALHGVTAGVGAPSVAAAPDGAIVVAERVVSGDLVVAEGPVGGMLSSTDASASFGIPGVAGRPEVSATTASGITVWWRTPQGHLEVLSQQAVGAAWTATDVTLAAGGPLLAGDPTIVTTPSGRVTAFVVTQEGTLAEFAWSIASSSWSESDPTGGLTYPALHGDVSVLNAPHLPGARVILATTASGDVIELSDELGGMPVPARGPWRAVDLSFLGAPPAASAITAPVASSPYGSYVSTWGRLIVITLSSGLPDGFSTTDLSSTADAAPARGAVPAIVDSALGPAVAIRTTAGDLGAFSIRQPGASSDLSFQPRTAELVGSDVAAAVAGHTEVLVGVDAGPIAPTPLQRRILLTASSFDQQHRRLEETPGESECNPFSAAFGRGSTWGCRPGTSAEAWCSDFAQWVWRHAGVGTSGITGWAATFATWGAAHHRVQFGSHFHALVGDAIVWGTRSPLYGTHVGIIVSVFGDQIDVVSGNAG